MDFHPEGQLSVDGVPQKKAPECSFRVANGLALQQALNNEGATGFSFGAVECSFSFSYEIPDKGAEFNAIRAVVKKTRHSLRFKDAGDRYTIEGAFGDADCRYTKSPGVVTVTANGMGILKLT